jgi:hypothetical protein
MARYQKTLEKVLSGASDTNIGFADLRNLLAALGFEERIKGGHHIFTLEGERAAINIQSDGSKEKPYQVKQVRRIIIQQGWVGDGEEE